MRFASSQQPYYIRFSVSSVPISPDFRPQSLYWLQPPSFDRSCIEIHKCKAYNDLHVAFSLFRSTSPLPLDIDVGGYTFFTHNRRLHVLRSTHYANKISYFHAMEEGARGFPWSKFLASLGDRSILDGSVPPVCARVVPSAEGEELRVFPKKGGTRDALHDLLQVSVTPTAKSRAVDAFAAVPALLDFVLGFLPPLVGGRMPTLVTSRRLPEVTRDALLEWAGEKVEIVQCKPVPVCRDGLGDLDASRAPTDLWKRPIMDRLHLPTSVLFPGVEVSDGSVGFVIKVNSNPPRHVVSTAGHCVPNWASKCPTPSGKADSSEGAICGDPSSDAGSMVDAKASDIEVASRFCLQPGLHCSIRLLQSVDYDNHIASFLTEAGDPRRRVGEWRVVFPGRLRSVVDVALFEPTIDVNTTPCWYLSIDPSVKDAIERERPDLAKPWMDKPLPSPPMLTYEDGTLTGCDVPWSPGLVMMIGHTGGLTLGYWEGHDYVATLRGPEFPATSVQREGVNSVCDSCSDHGECASDGSDIGGSGMEGGEKTDTGCDGGDESGGGTDDDSELCFLEFIADGTTTSVELLKHARVTALGRPWFCDAGDSGSAVWRIELDEAMENVTGIVPFGICVDKWQIDGDGLVAPMCVLQRALVALA